MEDRLELLDKTPSAQQWVSQELQNDNHQAYLGKYILMVMEYLTEEELLSKDHTSTTINNS